MKKKDDRTETADHVAKFHGAEAISNGAQQKPQADDSSEGAARVELGRTAPDDSSEQSLTRSNMGTPEPSSLVQFQRSLIMLVSGGCLVLASRFLHDEDSNDRILRLATGMAGLLLVVAGASGSSLAYLAGALVPTSRTRSTSATPDAVRHLQTLIDSRFAQLEKRIADALFRERSNIHEPEGDETTAADLRVTQLETAVVSIQEPGTVSDQVVTVLRREYRLAQERLSAEVASLSRRGTYNLVIGAMTTVFAAGVLIYAVNTANATGELRPLLVHFVPRLSVVVFMEVFAFFFLRLYRSSLEDIKYFQNELTNLQLKAIALEAASTSEPSVRAKVIEILAQTERNFRLAKDESTVELERLKAESAWQKEFASLIGSVLKFGPKPDKPA